MQCKKRRRPAQRSDEAAATRRLYGSCARRNVAVGRGQQSRNLVGSREALNVMCRGKRRRGGQARLIIDFGLLGRPGLPCDAEAISFAWLHHCGYLLHRRHATRAAHSPSPQMRALLTRYASIYRLNLASRVILRTFLSRPGRVSQPAASLMALNCQPSTPTWSTVESVRDRWMQDRCPALHPAWLRCRGAQISNAP